MALKNRVDTYRGGRGGGGAQFPPQECAGGLMHPPTPSGDSEPPRESQKRAIATLNDSGSERRPPDWERESGTGAARGPRRRDLAGVARGRAGSAARGPTGAPGRRAGSAPAARGSAAGAERQSGREGSAPRSSRGYPVQQRRRRGPRPALGHRAAHAGGDSLGENRGGRRTCEAARRPDSEHRAPDAWASSLHPHGLRSGRGLRGTAARRHV